jgi:hypothetical protein
MSLCNNLQHGWLIRSRLDVMKTRLQTYSSAREVAAVVLGFSTLSVLMTYPLVREIQGALPNDLGDPLLVAWALGWDADRLRHGLQGIWDAQNFYPYLRTLTYSEHFLGIAVFSAPVQWLSGNPIFAYNFAFLFSYVVAGCGMYWLTVSITGNRLAAIVAGLAFAFVPYRVAAVPHLHVLTFGWMPVGLLALHRYLASGSRTALLGFVVAFLLQGLSNLYFLYFFALPVSVVVMAGLFRQQRPIRRMLVELGLAGVVILLVLTPVGLAYSQTHADLGFERSRASMVSLSADVVSYIQVSPRLTVWGDVLTRGRAEGQLFPGFMLLGLAASGLLVGFFRGSEITRRVTPRCRSAIRLYGVIGLLAFVLSLGPEPRAFGHVLLSSGPYDWLLAVVPGLEGIRVVARLAVVVYLALCVLAAVGVTALLSRLSHPAGIGACVLIGIVVVGEGYGGPLPMVTFEPHKDVNNNAAYEWLSASVPGAVLELPLGSREPMTTYYNTRYQYATLQHGHPVVNGYSGYSTPLFRYLNSSASPLFELRHFDELLRGLRSLGVRYIVVHEELYGNRTDAWATIEAIGKQKKQVVQKLEFGETTVFWLAEWNERSGRDDDDIRELSLSISQLTTSHRNDRLSMAVDGDRDTRWLTGERQRGTEWIEIRLDRPQDVRLVKLGMRNLSMGDYPRGLVVESVDAQGMVHQLYRRGVLPQLLQGLVRDPRWITVDIPLPPNRTNILRLRQTRRTTWYWSIHELSLWTAAQM